MEQVNTRRPRLTAQLRRRVLSLPVGERTILMGEILTSLEDVHLAPSLEAMGEVMESVSGIPFRERNRSLPYVRARAVFAACALEEGYTQREVGDYLGTNHCTVHYLGKKMAEAIEYPNLYQDYITLYNDYTKAIKR